jgi:HAD superfamily hydrolase (TIGR01509 family)
MLLIFDCDGVILDSMNIHTEVEAAAYNSIGIKITPAQVARRFAGYPQPAISKILSEETGISIPPELHGLMKTNKKAIFAERLQPVPGIREALKELDGIPRCIASGTGVAGLTYTLGLTGLYDHFAPHIYSSEMVKRGKPFPDLFLHAAEQAGHAPKDCIVIEDAGAGVEAALAAGMRVFGFSGGSHCGPDHAAFLKDAGAETVFAHMDMLPGLIRGLAA